MSQNIESVGDDLDFQIELADNDIEQPKQARSTPQNEVKAENVGEAADQGSYLSKASHPTAVIFHLLFKAIAVTCYVLMSIADASNSLIFIIVTIACAFDFWVVKNVTGR